ncbi:MAG: SRPBCC family protein [Deltaproteobacteria bacterium]|nr:MAG: SRPBCC family protein [Deltaproteobacteria bacterium]
MHVHIETEIDAPAQVVWQVLAHEFGTIETWSSTVVSSRALTVDELPDDARVDPAAPVAARQTTSAFVTAREYFTAFDDAGMVFTFAALDLPFFLTRAMNTSRVEALDAGRSRVTFDVDMVLWGPFALGSGLMKARFTKAMRAVHADLKAESERRCAEG